MATSPRSWASSRKSDRCASSVHREGPCLLSRDELCTSGARNKHGLRPPLWSVWRSRRSKAHPVGVAHSFYRFYLFSISSFRKQDIAQTTGFIGDGLIILISTVICYYCCLCISIDCFPYYRKTTSQPLHQDFKKCQKRSHQREFSSARFSSTVPSFPQRISTPDTRFVLYNETNVHSGFAAGRSRGI